MKKRMVNGYWAFYTKKKNTIYEHRLKFEIHIKRKLKNTEQIHHINGIRTDNRLKNLQLLSISDHRKLHAKENEVIYLIRCKYCKTEFGSKKQNRKYCSVKCNNLSKRPKLRPSDKELKIVLKNNKNNSELGRIYNVSETAVRKWRRKLNT